ncbi:MAG: HNH endonuclease [Waterburya sp.]
MSKTDSPMNTVEWNQLNWRKIQKAVFKLQKRIYRAYIKCNWCGLTFRSEDLIETDHIIPRAIGGNLKDNLQLLHKHCHDIKTKEDLKAIKQHKVKKEWQKTLEKFNKMNWFWVDDIPTLVNDRTPDSLG